MANQSAVKVGWLGPSLPSSSHIQKFHKLIPAGVEIVYERLILHEGVLNDVRGKLDFIVERAVRFAEAQGLDGLIFPGAPREVLNPGLFAAFSAALKIPVTTALRASSSALQTFGATRVLLLTPFDAALNAGIRDFLTDFGISGVSPSEVLASLHRRAANDARRCCGLCRAGDGGTAACRRDIFSGCRARSYGLFGRDGSRAEGSGGGQ